MLEKERHHVAIPFSCLVSSFLPFFPFLQVTMSQENVVACFYSESNEKLRSISKRKHTVSQLQQYLQQKQQQIQYYSLQTQTIEIISNLSNKYCRKKKKKKVCQIGEQGKGNKRGNYTISSKSGNEGLISKTARASNTRK